MIGVGRRKRLPHCFAAESWANPFTKDGLETFVHAPRTQYLIGHVEARCGRAAQAAERWRGVASATGTANLAWAWGAAKKLDGYDKVEWAKRLESALAHAADGPPYTAGMLEAVLGRQAAARAHFQQALLLPDRMMSHHLSPYGADWRTALVIGVGRRKRLPHCFAAQSWSESAARDYAGRAAQAAERWRGVASATGTANLAWAWGAAKKLDGYDKVEWAKRLESALAHAADGPPYTAGMLEAVLGRQAAARAHFQQALLLPDRMMSHHLSRMALTGGLP